MPPRRRSAPRAKDIRDLRDYWPRAPEDIPYTGLLNGVPTYVAGRTLAGPLGWSGSTLVAGDLAESIITVQERHDEETPCGRTPQAHADDSGEASAGPPEAEPGE
jgi:hypothetical protein